LKLSEPRRTLSAVLGFLLDARIEHVRLIGVAFGSNQRFELGSTAVAQRIGDGLDRNASILTIDVVDRQKLSREDPVRVRTLHVSLREPMHPGTRQLLHTKDVGRAEAGRLMARVTVE
jgi:hypothetical protein